jgi:hypothetical protein
MTGYCSNCHKIWTLEERQGVCRWCGQPASCQTTTTKPRRLKCRRREREKQADHNNNGYDQLPEPYLTYYKIALRFAHKAFINDSQDLLHDIIEGLARVAEHKTLSEAAMYRLAEHIKDHYWYKHYSYHNGMDCQHCRKAQRAKCRKNWAYSDWAYCDCHKAIQLESLNQPIVDSEGKIIELAELIADPDSLDPEFWDKESLWQLGYEPRLVAIANKLKAGTPLGWKDHKYLQRYRREAQKKLFSMSNFGVISETYISGSIV